MAPEAPDHMHDETVNQMRIKLNKKIIIKAKASYNTNKLYDTEMLDTITLDINKAEQTMKYYQTIQKIFFNRDIQMRNELITENTVWKKQKKYFETKRISFFLTNSLKQTMFLWVLEEDIFSAWVSFQKFDLVKI